jgi:hypothetical protein
LVRIPPTTKSLRLTLAPKPTRMWTDIIDVGAGAGVGVGVGVDVDGSDPAFDPASLGGTVII